MRLMVNGDVRIVPKSSSICDLIGTLGLNPEHIVVEHNKEILAKEKWDDVVLAEGDQVELITFVGGG